MKMPRWFNAIPEWGRYASCVALGFLLSISAAMGYGYWETNKTAEWITAISTVVLAVGTFGLALVGIGQIRVLAEQQRKWTTLQACDRYDSDPVLNMARDVVCRHVNGVAQTSLDLNHAALRLLNYFDAIAIGIDQNLYRDELAKDHLGNIVFGKLEQLRSIDDSKVKELLAALGTDFSCLDKMVIRWGKPRAGAAFRDEG